MNRDIVTSRLALCFSKFEKFLSAEIEDEEFLTDLRNAVDAIIALAVEEAGQRIVRELADAKMKVVKR